MPDALHDSRISSHSSALPLGGSRKALVEGMGLSDQSRYLARTHSRTARRAAPTPRVLGVDDFSFCKRRRSYGAILIDLERRVPIDLLPDREAATLKKWLRTILVWRSSAGSRWLVCGWGEAGAPHAQQMADRWHLLSNLTETMKGFFLNKQPALQVPGAKAIRGHF